MEGVGWRGKERVGRKKEREGRTTKNKYTEVCGDESSVRGAEIGNQQRSPTCVHVGSMSRLETRELSQDIASKGHMYNILICHDIV